MFNLFSSNECFLSVAFITALSSIYTNGVVVARCARPIVWLLLPSLVPLQELEKNKLAGVQIITNNQIEKHRRLLGEMDDL